jgi:hypothetical protein
MNLTCDLGHEWSSHKKLSKCPYCTNRKTLEGFNDFGCRYPQIIKEWSESNEGSPHDFVSGSNKSVEWNCSNGHVWIAPIASRSKGSGCRKCFFEKAKEDDLWNNRRTKFLKDEHPDLFSEVVNQEENDSISFSSHKEIEWKCHLGHLYKLAPNVRLGGRGCPYCAGRKVLIGFNDVSTRNPHLRNELVNERDGDLPSWWREPIEWRHIAKDGLEHRWFMAPVSRLEGAGCNVCSGRILSVGANDVATTHPKIAAQWAPTNAIRPTEVTRGNGSRIDFICPNGHEWNAAVKDATLGKASCIDCKPTKDYFRSKAEMEVCEFVSVLAEVEENVKRFKKYGVNEIDCFCPNEEIAIDYNGIWWHQEVFKGKDYHKNKAAAIKSLGFAHVVIWEDNWVANKEKILTELTYIIKTVQSGEALDPSLITLMPELADPKEELLAA